MTDCLFCKIIAGEIPSSKVYEDDVCFAFNDIAPQAPTHFLVIPKTHIASVSEVTEESSGVVAHIFAVIAKLAKEKGMDSYRVVSNIGEQAGQSVFHLHFHVLSGRDMTWPPGLPVFLERNAGKRAFARSVYLVHIQAEAAAAKNNENRAGPSLPGFFFYSAGISSAPLGPSEK